MKLFLAALKKEFRNRGISNKDIADKLCKTPATIGEWFNLGTRAKNIDEMMTAFGITLKEVKFK